MRAELANLNHCAVPFLTVPTPTGSGTIMYALLYDISMNYCFHSNSLTISNINPVDFNVSKLKCVRF